MCYCNSLPQILNYCKFSAHIKSLENYWKDFKCKLSILQAVVILLNPDNEQTCFKSPSLKCTRFQQQQKVYYEYYLLSRNYEA